MPNFYYRAEGDLKKNGNNGANNLSPGGINTDIQILKGDVNAHR